MHELTTAFLHFDPPFPALVGGSLLDGWLVAKPGHHYTDLRVVAGTEIFPGIYGYPRRDLAEFFKSDQTCLLAGFRIAFHLPAGRHRLQLEACSIQGCWVPIDSIEREITPDEALPDPQPLSPLDVTAAGEMLRVLLRRLGAAGSEPGPSAVSVVQETPSRHHLQHPPRPFHGHLDQPQLWSRSLFGRMPVTGWVFHESQPIKRLFATTDLQAVQNLQYGRATPFLAGRNFTSPHSTHCGYDGFLDLPSQLPRPVTARVYAELTDGSWHLGSVAHFTYTDHEFAKQDSGPFTRSAFLQARRAQVGAIKARGWQMPAGKACREVIRQVWQEYSAQTPLQAGSVTIPVPVAGRSAAPDCGTIQLITHNLSHEGAPLFLLEYARHLRQETGRKLAVTSAREGPLRRDFEAIGATVQVIDATPLLDPKDAAGLRQALHYLAGQVDLRAAVLVVANTLSSWWGVHLARQAGRPVLFYIHESTPPRAFFHGRLPAPALALVEESFRLADRVSFLTATTQRYYAGLSDASNTCLNPGWIDLAGIDRFRAAHPRNELRARLGLTPDRILVINVGTVCERKGQHLFARAVDLLWRSAPALAASAEFIMIGGRDTSYDRLLADFLAGLNRPNIRIMPETAGVYAYYGAADLFVCSSYEESFPRVVLEAMAFALPIVSTGVHGIPEIARPDREALLVPAGDSAALAAALQRLLGSPETGRSLARSARTRVAAEFDSQVVLPRHAALARSLFHPSV